MDPFLAWCHYHPISPYQHFEAAACPGHAHSNGVTTPTRTEGGVHGEGGGGHDEFGELVRAEPDCETSPSKGATLAIDIGPQDEEEKQQEHQEEDHSTIAGQPIVSTLKYRRNSGGLEETEQQQLQQQDPQQHVVAVAACLENQLQSKLTGKPEFLDDFAELSAQISIATSTAASLFAHMKRLEAELTERLNKQEKMDATRQVEHAAFIQAGADLVTFLGRARLALSSLHDFHAAYAAFLLRAAEETADTSSTGVCASHGGATNHQMKLFVEILPEQATNETLDAYFGQFGYADSYVMMDTATGKSLGYGMVHMSSADENCMDMAMKDEHEMDQNNLSVRSVQDMRQIHSSRKFGPQSLDEFD